MFRFLFSILFSASVFFVNAQDCKLLDQLHILHGLKFGFRLPDSIKRHFETYIPGTTIKDYRLTYDSLKEDIRDKIGSWFWFAGGMYEDVGLYCLDDGRFYGLGLVKALYGSDSLSVAKNEFPTSFWQANNEITSIWGDATRDTNYNDVMGSWYDKIWECNQTKIELLLNKTPYMQSLNWQPPPMMQLQITDVLLGKINKINSLSK